MLFLDGVYVDANDEKSSQRFVAVAHPTAGIEKIIHKISLRIARYLERAGFIESDAENSYLTESARTYNEISEYQTHSINYRISIGPQKGKKIFSLQTLPPIMEEIQNKVVGNIAGFSLHAGVYAKSNQRDKLERLCRYISRPPVSEHRLSLTEQGNIRYELKTPYRNGTTHMIFEPLDFISKLVALVPAPRVNLTRFHGVFGANSKHRSRIINQPSNNKTLGEVVATQSEKRIRMTWAQRLKRAFNIDITTCVAQRLRSCEGHSVHR
jgi:hypothetical protein